MRECETLKQRNAIENETLRQVDRETCVKSGARRKCASIPAEVHLLMHQGSSVALDQVSLISCPLED